jgi:tetratricopeptide (TPR) repeat protein
MEPAIGLSYANLVADYLYLDRLPEAQSTAEAALAKKLDSPLLRTRLYFLAFLQNDEEGMARQLAWAMGQPADQGSMLSVQSDTEAYKGHLSKAREFSRKAVDYSHHADQKETAATWQANAALREAEFGNSAQARQLAIRALALAPGRDVKVLVALALARSGDYSGAQKLADELTKTYSANTLLNSYWLPTIEAAIELDHQNRMKAVELLEASLPYELGTPPPFTMPTLYPIYLRGEAYLEAHRPKEAAVEFQKILDHRGAIVNFPLGVLAHLQLGRTYALLGDTDKAKSAYQDFFALWKEADPDLPILRKANAEYAKLQ